MINWNGKWYQLEEPLLRVWVVPFFIDLFAMTYGDTKVGHVWN